jgi:predicted exporter
MNQSSFSWLTERRFRAAGLLWLAVLLLAGALLAQRWHSGALRIQSNIYALLPASEYRPEVTTAYQRVNDEVNNRLFIALQAADPTALERATGETLRRAADSGLLSGAPLTDAAGTGPGLYAHRAVLLSDADREALLGGNYPALTERALAQLASPLFNASDQQLREDPLLLFPRFLMERAAGAGASELEQGWPTRHDARHSLRLLVFTLRGKPFNLDYQSQLLPWVEQLRAQAPHWGASVRATGTVLYAAAASNEAQREISIISLGASLGLMVLIWIAFRSPRPLLTETASLAGGCLIAFLGTELVFGEVHLMTLIFGASLIGVSVDYSMHFMCAQAAHPERPALLTLKDLLPGLLMGLITTVAAYVCMAATPFPGLMQIAVFSGLGLLASWVTGVLMLPRLRPLDTRHARAAVRRLVALRLWAAQHLRWRMSLLLGLPVLALVLALQWRVDDNVRNLQSMDPGLLRDEAFIQENFQARQSGQFMVVYGADEAVTAEREASLLVRLRTLVAQHRLQGFQALGQWWPTTATQAQTLKALQDLPDAVLRNYADAAGLDYAQLRQWRSDLAGIAPLPTGTLELPALRPLHISAGIRLVTLTGISDYAQVAAAAKLPGVQFVDPVNELSATFGRYRRYGSMLVLVATVLLAAVLAWRYGLAAVPGTLGPVLLSMLTTLLLLLWCGVSINLFVVMALFLILGIGVDYSIFYQESYAHGASVAVGVTLCMLSTALGFGLLGISHTTVIHGFGLTVLFGVLTSFLFASLMTHAHSADQSLQ